ncbi:MAG: hypothetical protein DI573_14295 [Microbacterium sp.]|nr:MAG: hypothetical protein DI573_14295 [Microbacterium sp.]
MSWGWRRGGGRGRGLGGGWMAGGRGLGGGCRGIAGRSLALGRRVDWSDGSRNDWGGGAGAGTAPRMEGRRAARMERGRERFLSLSKGR